MRKDLQSAQALESLLYEPIIDTDLPQGVSYVFERVGRWALVIKL